MANIQRHAIVPYSPQQMFSLVDDVNHYSDFLPWCASSAELSREDNVVVGCVELAKGAVHKSFTTRNTLTPYERIEMQLVEGPFRHLHGYWRFQPLNDGKACKVMLELDYEFSNRLVSLAIGPVFNTVANSLVDAFVERANKTYG
ncbi:MAG TPA: type II toxin-antitoxin system RatA family toxin [Gammaproteobacteria bacterium]|nr:type II toxin-antitoxin system RatA family toxin [Gammaproteobacteria bacterium]